MTSAMTIAMTKAITTKNTTPLTTEGREGEGEGELRRTPKYQFLDRRGGRIEEADGEEDGR